MQIDATNRFLVLGGSLAIALVAAANDQPGAQSNGRSREVEIKDITLTVPARWKQEEPANKLRLAQFRIPAAEGDQEPAELVVSSFGGGGGGTEANVQRWINQFAPDGRTTKLTRGKSAQGSYVFVDLTGTYNQPVGPPVLQQTRPAPGSRMLGVILSVEGKGNYFLKLTGPQKTVTAAAEEFRTSFGGDAAAEEPYKLPE